MTLKRTPLLRKVPMQRTGRLVRTALAPVSKKRRAANKVRRANVHEAFGDDPVCWICDASRADDAHELLSRARGGSITDTAGMIPVCRACHDRVTRNPTWAESMMFALPSPPRHDRRYPSE